ncbi:hypothetical protein LOC67_07550 [Stieleria sp. JC731]|uniref:hypothetical protein n=1 Tax=Pirellulaceae TaxID=2691357 RepID=UPI001E31D6C8|nr:hypothetical protein [Stieleria sp. JC731]MCC9600411.1 hypothetical protein [Stieleria sp. JC731]
MKLLDRSTTARIRMNRPASKPVSFTSLRPLFLLHKSLIITLLIGVSIGCQKSDPQSPKVDEAMQRAKRAKIKVEDAVRFYSYRDGQPVPDLFAGMDAIHQGDPDSPDALLDKSNGKRAFAEVVDVDLRRDSISKSDNEIIGRNTWMAWCAGNEGFWDWLATDSLGFIDLLKLVDSRERQSRFEKTGMINEPGMMQSADGTRIKHEFGLWLDQPTDPFYRQWRQYYLEQTFEELKAGNHYSQIGLHKRSANGGYTGPSLYQGEPRDTPKKPRYRYPSDYLPDEMRESIYALSISRAETQVQPGKTDVNQSYEAYQSDKFDTAHDNPYDKRIPPPDLYGLSSGVIGLRLFPNPYFDAEAQAKWDPDAYQKDRSYWSDPNLIRPFRVGMSCAFCHTSFHPLRPPKDIQNPRWENLSGNIGAQYLSMRATVGGLLEPDNFVYHLLESQPRGTIDTSLIASDNINNPNTMNAIFGLPQRAILSLSNPQERLSKTSASLPSLWDDNQSAPVLRSSADNPSKQIIHPGNNLLGDAVNDMVAGFWSGFVNQFGLEDRIIESNGNPRFVPRILLDGSDSIGTWGALARVYLNIGSYWEQWNELHQVVIGFEPQRPFLLRDCETNSVYWNATEKRVPGLRDYFLQITPPMPLLSTPDGTDRLDPIEFDRLKQLAEQEKQPLDALLQQARAQHVDWKQLARGRQVFAANCIVCHSSIQPESHVAHTILPPRKSLCKKLIEFLRHTFCGIPPSQSDFTVDEFKSLATERKAYRERDEQTGEFWEHEPGRWLDDPTYQRWANWIVDQPAFWKHNYLSTDYRIPINVVGTNSSRAMATNGMSGRMWQDFASESYRELPSPGEIEYFDPYKGENGEWSTYSPRHTAPEGVPNQGGGPGYYRVPSLISIWATAPFLHNNSLGLYNNDPSVDGRLEAFDDAIRKLLWKEKRLESSSYNGATAERLEQDNGLIWRTPQETYLTIDSKRTPTIARSLLNIGGIVHSKYFGWLHGIWPNWLPSAILLGGAFLMLSLSNSRLRHLAATWIFIASLLICFGYIFVSIGFAASIITLFRDSELWIPVVTLGILGIVLSLPVWHNRQVQRSGNVIALVAIVLGSACVLLRTFPDLPLDILIARIHPWWLPGAAGVLVAISLWLPLNPLHIRFSSYGLVILSLILGTMIYYKAGDLGDITIGPIPKGTPVNLLANFNPEADRKDQIKAISAITSGLAEIKSRGLNDPANAEELDRVMKKEIAPALMSVNKCPDFVMDRGHDYPWFDNMSDADKDALIELLKTL